MSGCRGAGVTGNCEPPDVAAGNRTLMVWKSRTCSQPLSRLSSSGMYLLCRVSFVQNNICVVNLLYIGGVFVVVVVAV